MYEFMSVCMYLLAFALMIYTALYCVLDVLLNGLKNNKYGA